MKVVYTFEFMSLNAKCLGSARKQTAEETAVAAGQGLGLSKDFVWKWMLNAEANELRLLYTVRASGDKTRRFLKLGCQDSTGKQHKIVPIARAVTRTDTEPRHCGTRYITYGAIIIH